MRYAWLLLLLPVFANAQERVKGRVVDAGTREVLPYCSVRTLHSGPGTITNADGDFELMVVPEDSLVISMIGYARTTVAIEEVKRTGLVTLQASITVLSAVEVRPESGPLLALVAKSAAGLRLGKAIDAKVYFEMGTRMNERPVEVVECFYNGRIDGPHPASLDLKQGRIGLAPAGDRFFVNLNSTKAMCLLDIRQPQDHFPANPFQWTKAKALARHYRAQEIARSTDGGPLVQVRLVPKDTNGRYFTAEAWIDAATGRARSITLHCTDCGVHPFLPIRPTDTIRSIDMDVRFVLAEDNKLAQLEHMELSYTMDFQDTAVRSTIRTEAVLHVFDRGTPFLLPVFEYDRTQYDHHKILFQPYDSSFWATAPALVRTDRQEQDRRFFALHGVLTGSSRPSAFQGHHFLASNYIHWSPDHRLSLRGITPPPDAATQGSAVGPGQIALKTQLYMDVDMTNGAPRIFTAAVFDGVRSYYHAPELRQTDAYLNIAFDLCEIERRRLDEALRAPGLDHEAMLRSHQTARRNVERTTEQLAMATRSGTDLKALAEWNERVKLALGIDNFALIGLVVDKDTR